jgi:hypothetical protein
MAGTTLTRTGPRSRRSLTRPPSRHDSRKPRTERRGPVIVHWSHDVGVDRTTGLPTNVYTVIRKPDGSVLTMFPGTSPKS